MNVNFERCPGVPGPTIPRLLVIFVLVFFFQSDRPTDPISGNVFDGKRGKKGMAIGVHTIPNIALPRKALQYGLNIA